MKNTIKKIFEEELPELRYDADTGKAVGDVTDFCTKITIFIYIYIFLALVVGVAIGILLAKF